MTKIDQEYMQPLGLDVGTSRIVVARSADNKKYRYESELNAFLTLPYSRLTESLLKSEKVFHDVRGEEILVAGNDAQRFAEVFHVETRRPMANGVLNPQEPHSLLVLQSVITRLAGPANIAGQKIFYSVPAPIDGNDTSISYHQACVGRILTELGYAPTAIGEGLAVVFAELADFNYSGIGISCGSGLCNVCLAVLSVPVMAFSVPKAGDFIDSQAALVTGDRAIRLRLRKEQAFHLNGLGVDRVHDALSIYYQEVIVNLAQSLCRQISTAQRMPKIEQAIPLVLSGGTSMPTGFLDHFSKVLRSYALPFKLLETRVSADPLNSTARGALMAALC
jgi:hypothetical protein